MISIVPVESEKYSKSSAKSNSSVSDKSSEYTHMGSRWSLREAKTEFGKFFVLQLHVYYIYIIIRVDQCKSIVRLMYVSC